MTSPTVSGYFTWAASKTLSAVDVDRLRSHQHEIGGVAALRRFLEGINRVDANATEATLDTVILALGYSQGVERSDESLKLYDARRENPNRGPEWRLYYPSGGATEALLRDQVRPGDLLVFAVPETGPDLVLFLASDDSAWSSVLGTLFPSSTSPGQRMLEVSAEQLEAAQDTAPLLLVLDDLGLTPPVDISALDWALAQPELSGGLHGLDSFPSTADMASMAVRYAGSDLLDLSVDDRLMTRLEAETSLFYAIESAIALPLFQECVVTADYIDLAKSVTQRRAARRGRSFEIHLEEIFLEEALAVEMQPVLPDGERLDFLFPSLDAYLDDRVDTSVLFAVNAKTTVRERWRQLASEAQRLRTKYLITVDRNLASASVDQMVNADVQLVIPEPIRAEYGSAVVGNSWSLAEFVGYVGLSQQ